MYLPAYVAITVPGLAAPRRKPPGTGFCIDPTVPVPEPPVGNVDTRDLVFIELLFLSAYGVFLSEGVIFLFMPLIESSLLFDFWFCKSVTGEADLILALAVAAYEVALYLPLDAFLFTGDSGRLPTEAAVVDEGLSSSSKPPFCIGLEEPGL